LKKIIKRYLTRVAHFIERGNLKLNNNYYKLKELK